MEVLVLIIVILCVTAAGILVGVSQKFRAAERKKYYRAAHRIIREQYLDGALKNAESRGVYADRRRLMLALKVKGSKGTGYVFDPAQEIKIGRSMETSDICLQDLAVSSNHCSIFLYEEQLCIKDMNSANGTVVKSRWKSREALFGDMTFLYNKSRIWVGNTCFLVTLFYCEIAAE